MSEGGGGSRPGAVVIAGPTAGGKSALAVEVALVLRERGVPAEIVTADAFQVYRGMDIGTAKPAEAERRGVPHRLIDLMEPGDRFTVADWLKRADSAICEVNAAGGVPIVVGGTHLYIKALLEGLFEGPEVPAAVTEAVRAMDPRERRAELERHDPEAAGRIHPNDERRTVRALSVLRHTGVPISEHQRQWDRGAGPRHNARLALLDWQTPEINSRINRRVKQMMAGGLLEETAALAGRVGPQAREALGYKQLLAHLAGRCTLEDAVERIKIETRRLAKNQRTWIRRLAVSRGAFVVSMDAAAAGEGLGGVAADLLERAGLG